MLNKEKNFYSGTATNATTRLIDHVGNKKGSEIVELIELATLISKLGGEIKKLDKEIELTVNIKQKNELIVVYNKAIEELGKAHELQAKKTKKEWNHVLPRKKDLVIEKEEEKPLEEELKPKEVVTQQEEQPLGVNKTAEENLTVIESVGEDTVIEKVPPTGENPENQSTNTKNQRGEPNTIKNESFEEVEGTLVVPNNSPEGQTITNQNQRGEPNAIGSVSVRGEEAGEEIKGEKGTSVTEEAVGDETEDKLEEVKPVGKEELMEQLKLQMDAMLEVEKKIQELKEENLELENFIAEQEEKEKGEILKEEALKVLNQGKKAGIKKDDPKLNIFKKEWIDEVYGKGK